MAENILARMAVQIAANTAEFNKALSNTDKGIKSFQASLKTTAAAIGVAFGVREIAQFAISVSKLAGEAQGVETAFKRLPNSTALMNDLKEATGGTVSELDLMKRAVQGANFGIELEVLPNLLEFATLRAQQTGQSVDYLVDSIVTGIGRKSPLILDNLGISAVQLQKALGGVSVAAADVGQVAEAVGKVAGENLQNMAGFSENASTKMQRLTATWENLQVEIGKAINNSGALTWLIDMGNAFGDMLKMANSDPVMERFAQQTAEAVKEFKKLNDEMKNEARQQLAKDILHYEKGLKELITLQKVFFEQAGNVGARAALAMAEQASGMAFSNFQEGMEFLSNINKHISDQEKAIKSLKDQYVQYLEVLKGNTATQIGLLEGLQAELKVLEEQKLKAFDAATVAKFNDEIKRVRAEIDLLNASTAKTTQFFKESLKNAQQGKTTDVSDPSSSTPGNPFLTQLNVESPLIEERKEIQLTLEEWRNYYAIKRELEEEDIARKQEQMQTALEFGSVVGNSLADAATGQKKFSDAMRQLTAELIKMFFQRAMAGIISSAASSGAPPPVALAMAAAGVGVIAAMFSKFGASGGKVSGSGGGISSSSRATSTMDRVSSSGIQDAPTVTFVLKGSDLWGALKNFETSNKWTKVVPNNG